MKDIYINMNTQNILKYYGTKFDLKLDHSEFYDYELGNNEIDYNVDILSNEPIVYNSLKISESLGNFSCHKNTISLIEYDNRNNDFQGFVLDDSPKTVEEQLEIIKKYLERSMPRSENE